MALKTYECDGCGTRFAMDDADAEQVDELTCPTCGEPLDEPDEGEEEPAPAPTRSNPRRRNPRRGR